MQWRGVRRPSVGLSVNFLRKSLLFADKWPIATKFAHDGLRWAMIYTACIQGVLKVRVKGHVMPAHLEFHKKKSLTQSFSNYFFPLSVQFSSVLPHPNPQISVSLHCEWRHSSHYETVFTAQCTLVQSAVLSWDRMSWRWWFMIT